MKWAHGHLVRALIVASQLSLEVFKRVETGMVIETFLVFSMAPFDLAIMSGGVRSDAFVLDMILL